MKLALVLHSTEPETVWKAFRPGVFALKQGDTARACLLANGVEAESLPSDKFAVEDQMQSFVEAGGHILACGTCLKTRQSQGTDFCPISTMADLYDIVRESDRVLTFQQFADGANRASRPAGLARGFRGGSPVRAACWRNGLPGSAPASPRHNLHRATSSVRSACRVA